MLTNSASGIRWSPCIHFVFVYARFWFIPFVIFLPFRCFSEIIEGLSDILCLLKRTKAHQFMAALEDIEAQIRDYGPLDLADVNVSSRGKRICIRMLVR